MKIGTILRGYRAKNRIYQAELAHTLNISKPHLCRIELGQTEPNGEVMIKVLNMIMPDLKLQIDILEKEANESIEKNGKWLKKYHTNTTKINILK